MKASLPVLLSLIFTASSLTAQTNFSIDVQSDLKIEQGANKQDVEAQSVFDYSRTTKGDTVVLAIDRVHFVAKASGRVVRNLIMEKGGAKDGTTGEKVPTRGQSLYFFGEPMLEFKVDENGREVSRKLLVDETNLLVRSGDYQYANLFHSSFEKDKNEWTEKMLYPATQGVTINGDVTYKTTETKGSISKVKFEGVCDGDFKLRGLDCKNVKYVITGTKSYDAEKKNWTAGDMNVDMQFDVFIGGNKLMSTKGTFKYKFKTKK